MKTAAVAAVLAALTAVTSGAAPTVALVRQMQCMYECDKLRDNTCVTRVFNDNSCDLAGTRRVCRNAGAQLEITTFAADDCTGAPTATRTVATGKCAYGNVSASMETFHCDMQQQESAPQSNVVFASSAPNGNENCGGGGNTTYFLTGQCTARAPSGSAVHPFCATPQCGRRQAPPLPVVAPTPFIVARYYAGNTSAEYVTFELHNESGCDVKGAAVYALPASECFTEQTADGFFPTTIECY